MMIRLDPIYVKLVGQGHESNFMFSAEKRDCENQIRQRRGKTRTELETVNK